MLIVLVLLFLHGTDGLLLRPEIRQIETTVTHELTQGPTTGMSTWMSTSSTSMTPTDSVVTLSSTSSTTTTGVINWTVRTTTPRYIDRGKFILNGGNFLSIKPGRPTYPKLPVVCFGCNPSGIKMAYFKLLLTTQSGSQFFFAFTPYTEDVSNSSLETKVKHKLEVYVSQTNLTYIGHEGKKLPNSLKFVEVISQGWYKKFDVFSPRFQCYSEDLKCFHAETYGDFGNFIYGFNIAIDKGNVKVWTEFPETYLYFKTDVIPIEVGCLFC